MGTSRLSAAGSDLPTVRLDDDDDSGARRHATTRDVTGGSFPTEAAGDPDVLPTTVGRYRVLQRLGQGGMGVVYAAYDDELDRKVAVKLLLARMGRDDASRKRLLREAQAMAMLSHPNVGQIFEVGRHGGQVFIAMELIVGGTLRAWCDAEPRTWREILRMHAGAGDGLAAAHAVGLVHRDYKCDNVLVGEDGRPRVLDFGLARSEVDLSDAAPTESVHSGPIHDAITRVGTVMGTPAYMAPEQLAGRPVDARADQFSFCVALFECLYGKRPFPGSSVLEIASRVRSHPPLAVDAHTRGVPAGLHAAILRGLSVDPDERYATMPELLEALRGYLRRRSTARVMGLGVLGVAAVLGALSLGETAVDRRAEAACDAAGEAIESTWGEGWRAAVRRSFEATGLPRAPVTADKVIPMLDRQADAWSTARRRACRNAEVDGTWGATLAASATWCLDERRMELAALVDELSGADAIVVEKAVTAAASLAPVDACLDAGLLARAPTPPHEDIEAIARVRTELEHARALLRAGRIDRGLAAVDDALAHAEALQWAPLVAEATFERGVLLHEQGRYEEAAAVLEDAYFEATEAADPIVEADAAIKLVYTVGVRLSRHEEGHRWSRHARAAIAELGDGQDLRTADNLSHTALVDDDAGELAEALDLQTRALAIWERELGPTHLLVAGGLHNLAIIHDSLGEFDTAVRMYERALAIYEDALGPDHPDVATVLASLAATHFHTGALDEAQRLQERALAIREQTLGPDHPEVATSLNNIATLHQARGELKQALRLHQRALAIREKALGSEHPDTAQSMFNLAGVYWAMGDLDEAQALLERSLLVHEKIYGPDHPNVARDLDTLGAVDWSRGDFVQARERFTRALEIFEASLGPEHADVAFSHVNVAGACWSTHDWAEAQAHYERAIEIYEHAFGPDDAQLADPLHGLAQTLLDAGRPDEAADAAQRSLSIREHTGAPPMQIAGTQLLLARALWEADRDRPRARELATRARDAYAAAGEAKADKRATADAWLNAHRSHG